MSLDKISDTLTPLVFIALVPVFIPILLAITLLAPFYLFMNFIIKKLYLVLNMTCDYTSRAVSKVVHTFLSCFKFPLNSIESALHWAWSCVAPQTNNIATFPIVANY